MPDFDAVELDYEAEEEDVEAADAADAAATTASNKGDDEEGEEDEDGENRWLAAVAADIDEVSSNHTGHWPNAHILMYKGWPIRDD